MSDDASKKKSASKRGAGKPGGGSGKGKARTPSGTAGKELFTEPATVAKPQSAPLSASSTPRAPLVNAGALSMAEVAAHLERIAHLIQLVDDNPFRPRAYENAARNLESLPGTLTENLAAGKLDKIKGVGESIRTKLQELADSGHIAAEEELLEQIPPGLDRLLDVQGVGPKKVRKLWQDLGITSLDDLEQACRADKLSTLAGFGAKTQANILESIDFLRRVSDRVRIDQAWAAASRVSTVLAALKADGRITRYEVAGSLRRCRETIGDVDIVCSCDEAHAAAIADAFTSQPGVARVLGKGATKCSIVLDSGVQVDLRMVRDTTFPFTLMHFTGSKEHNIVMRQRAIERGMKLNEYGLFRAEDERLVECANEEAIYRALGLKQWVPPELREDMGEVAVAERGELPRLVEFDDVRGLFHMHTTYSDGRLSLYETAEVGVELGYEYFGITDHSQTAAYAGGLAPDRLRQQWDEIDEINREFAGRIRLLKGIESDILADGSLDYDDSLLAELDFVIVSVHSGFWKDAAKMTARIITAIEHPATTIVGHLTGRLLLQRDGYPVDTEAVLQACARTGTAIEINASPHRLDLDWRWVKRARELGVMVAINPDAHSRDGFTYVRYGLGIARKGWLRKQDVLNTRSLAEMEQWLATHKAAT